MAITSNNANNAKSTGTCVIEGIYNPTKTNKALQDCMTVKFNYLRVLAKHQLNLTTLRPGQDIQFNGNITFDVRVRLLPYYIGHYTSLLLTFVSVA